MRKWLHRRLEGLLDNVIWAAIFAGGAGVWSLLSDLPSVIVAVIGLAVFVLVLAGINQYVSMRERRKNTLTKTSDDEIERKIREWVDIPALSFQRREPNDKKFFQFLIHDTAGRPITITRTKTRPLELQLTTGLIPEDEFKTALSRLEQTKTKMMVANLMIELAKFGIQFEGVNVPLKRITLVDTVFLDESLSRRYFIERVLHTLGAFVLVETIIKSYLIAPTSHAEDSQP